MSTLRSQQQAMQGGTGCTIQRSCWLCLVIASGQTIKAQDLACQFSL
jgi:hypothetical protein